MTHDDEEQWPTTGTPCDVVRVTPFDADGDPVHDRATVVHFTQPVTLGYTPRWSRVIRSEATHALEGQRLPGLLAIAAPDDQPAPAAIAELAHVLEERRGNRFSIDTWSLTDAGLWVYTLVPCWQDVFPENWPPHHCPALRTLAVGHALPARGPYPWPKPAPLAGRCDTTIGTEVFYADAVAPPPADREPAQAPLAAH